MVLPWPFGLVSPNSARYPILTSESRFKNLAYICGALAACLLAVVAWPARAAKVLAEAPLAEAPKAVGPVRFTGATVGLGLQGGPTLLNDEGLTSRVGMTAGVAARMTGLLHVSDAELAYQFSYATPRTASGDARLIRQGVLVTAGFHPLYLLALGNTRLPYVLSNLHVDIGASYQLSTLCTPAGSATRGDIAWHWGGGFEVPLGDPNIGRAYWIGFRYRQVRVNTDLFRAQLPNVGEHQFLVTVEHRWNWK